MSEVIRKILLVEDDEDECNEYKKLIEQRKDIKLVGSTKSSSEAIKLVKACKPDGVILDLELNAGEGSGLEFIEKIKKMNLEKMPKIVVTTNIYSDSVYNFLHLNKIDFIFYKKQDGYSRENVINTLVLLKQYDAPRVSSSLKSENEEESDKLTSLINKDLDLIGIATHLKGRKYLFDAIYYVIENYGNEQALSVVQYLVGKYKRSSSTISRAMQNAILHAWRISSPEDLEALYTARINYETGVPTTTEFIYYYADRIRKKL